MKIRAQALLAGLLVAMGVAHADKQTVCTVTVNSPDERDVLRRQLPAERYDFVELVERGRRDWLASACRREVRCDVLVVSGHFAGTEFYSSRFNTDDTLPVDEIERAACSDGCPGLFAQLKEVYLFGCDTLNPTPTRTAGPEVVRSLVRAGATSEEAEREARRLAERYGESAFGHMRRLFSGVPLIYGFSSKAPYGRVAGPMLERHLQSGLGDSFGTGRVDERLVRLFAPASMTVTAGLEPGEANADFRGEACRYHDERLTPAAKLTAIHATLARSMAEARLSLERMEKFFAGANDDVRASPGFADALDALASDERARSSYLALVRDTPDPAVRVRLISLAREFRWLDAEGARLETVRMVGDVLATPAAGFGEVELICGLNRDRSLDAERHRLAGIRARGNAADAALACLGSQESRRRILGALASRDENDVQLAQAFLRHRPIEDAAELRTVALKVTAMEGTAAQVRALETLARHRIADRAILDELIRLYSRTSVSSVRRAIEEVFLRSEFRELSPARSRAGG
jgi:hypothetical protein